MAAETNPFKAALEREAGDKTPSYTRAPGAKGEGRNTAAALQKRTIAELGLVQPEVLEKTPKIRDLTVRDLNDLAAEFSGVKTRNTRVAKLSLEDIQSIEKVFFDFKVAAGRDLARVGLDNVGNLAASVDVSCCCCTPCCCCAATDMSHTA